MSDPERYIEELATELDRVNAFVSKNCKATGLRVLRERLLPVLEAGQAMRDMHQQWFSELTPPGEILSGGSMVVGAWDAALAAKPSRSGE